MHQGKTGKCPLHCLKMNLAIQPIHVEYPHRYDLWAMLLEP